MTTNGFLLVLSVLVPVIGVLLSVLLGGRFSNRIPVIALTVGFGLAVCIASSVWQSGTSVVYQLGGWAPPLGLELRADGLSAAMLLTASLVICCVGLSACKQFVASARESFVFFTLLMALSAAMNAVFLGNDLFNLYVALELLTFAAVPLVCLDGRAETIRSALRYLLFALVGSVLYLLGVALTYGAYGTLDIRLLAQQTSPNAVTVVAAALMTAGLMAKTALFPLHLWLPPAHAGAPSPASALLSGLVVKGSFFIVIRLWFGAMPWLCEMAAAQVLAACGAGAIVIGGVLALRQERLKMMIAYSTVAQIGYLFLIFPLGAATSIALTAGMMQAISHALAKAAMFLAAGLMVEVLGHDRIGGLRGMASRLPVTTFAFGLAALSLIGVPPTGGFAAKWMLLGATVVSGQWWLGVVILLGGLLAGAYLFRAAASMLGEPDEPLSGKVSISRYREGAALALAVFSWAVGLFSADVVRLLEVGR